jgi:hypothetical protein
MEMSLSYLGEDELGTWILMMAYLHLLLLP